MATINYKVQGSYPPFAVELRENSETGAIIQTMVALSADTQYSFTSVPDYGDFFVVAYDNAFGNNSDDVSFTTTTTTTPAPTTTARLGLFRSIKLSIASMSDIFRRLKTRSESMPSIGGLIGSAPGDSTNLSYRST